MKSKLRPEAINFNIMKLKKMGDFELEEKIL